MKIIPNQEYYWTYRVVGDDLADIERLSSESAADYAEEHESEDADHGDVIEIELVKFYYDQDIEKRIVEIIPYAFRVDKKDHNEEHRNGVWNM